jgi:hypothetical protein
VLGAGLPGGDVDIKSVFPIFGRFLPLGVLSGMIRRHDRYR